MFEDFKMVLGNSTHQWQWHFKGFPDNKFAPLTIVALFIFFAPGMEPLLWTINSEIYPTSSMGLEVQSSP